MLRRFLSAVIFIVLLLPGGFVFAQEPAGEATHTVANGENLYRIALQYGLTVEQLAAANGITDPALVYVGQVLLIPGVTVGGGEESVALSEQPVVESAPITTTQTRHIVQAGETLASIGRLYNVDLSTLASLNGITNTNSIYVGQELVISGTPVESAPAESAPAETAPVEAAPIETVVEPQPVAGETTHTVKPNEGLAAIARSYGVNWQAIAQANGITNANTIYVGQVLTIPNPTASPPADYSAPAPTNIVDNGKMILVELSKQSITAYENGAVVKTVIVSTGLPGTPTVQGDYYVYSKLPSQTMYGPGYYLPGVPWVMYFYQGYAIHGTYWHNNFGQPMSHGCVNLPSDEAEWFYNFAPMGTLVRVVY